MPRSVSCLLQGRQGRGQVLLVEPLILQQLLEGVRHRYRSSHDEGREGHEQQAIDRGDERPPGAARASGADEVGERRQDEGEQQAITG